MKRKFHLLPAFLFSFLFITAHSQNCDPWIQDAYKQVMNRSATAQECNIKNYNNGSWNNYCELVSYVAAYNKKGDPWIYKAYCELYKRAPKQSELNIRNYNNGSWNNYNELVRYIRDYQTAMIKERTERTQAAYMLAYGRKASESEVNNWLKEEDKSLSDILNSLQQSASGNQSTRRTFIIKSYRDILGRTPSESEINYWIGGTDLYYTLTKNHLQWLAGNPAEYEKVIQRSYQAVLKRAAQTAEINYWKSQGILSYAVLLSCHEEWKRTNGQTAQKTSGNGTISNTGSMLQTFGVSDKTAKEINNLGGFNNVISPGGANVISPGGGNVISPGGGNVISPGGGNVISPGGANAIAPSGGKVIAVGGAGVVAAGGLN